MKYIVVSLVILILGFFGFLNPVRNVYLKIVSPIQFGLSRSAADLKESASFYTNLKEIRNENIKLKGKINELESGLVDLKKYQEENKILKDQLGIKQEEGFGRILILASVMGNPTDLTGSTVFVSAGSKNGVAKGANVIVSNHIIGIVREVWNERSLVELVTSPDVSMTVYNIDGKNKVEGLATGDYGTSVKISRILPTEEVKAGDYIITSGKDGFILPGLVVGKVVDVQYDPSQPLKTASVDTLIDFSRLDKVFIVKE